MIQFTFNCIGFHERSLIGEISPCQFIILNRFGTSSHSDTLLFSLDKGLTLSKIKIVEERTSHIIRNCPTGKRFMEPQR